MGPVNPADESGGKPASNNNTASMSSSGNNIAGATNNDASSSFVLLQQVQSILLENNEAKARIAELENRIATFQTEREEIRLQFDEKETSSEQTIQSLYHQLFRKEEEWSKICETEEKNHKSNCQLLQTKLDDWESQHKDWVGQQEKYHDYISNLKEDKVRLESQVKQLEATLNESQAEVCELRQYQDEASKAHQQKVDELKEILETKKKDLEGQLLQKKEEHQRHEEQERDLNETILELRESVKQKDASLRSLNDSIEELRTEVSQLKHDHQTQVEDLEATIIFLEQENVAQSKQAEDYQTEIENLQVEMDSLKSVFLKQQKQFGEKEKLQQEQAYEEQEDQQLKWQDLVQSLRIQVQAQTNIAETQSRELEEVKEQNVQLRVQLHVSSQQKEQLERNWNETNEQLKRLEDRLSEQNNGRNFDVQKASGSHPIQQSQEIASLTEENRSLSDRIVQMEAQLVLGGSQSYEQSGSKEDQEIGLANASQNGSNDTIEQLQQRIMQLVEEKLILQSAVETLQHEFKESNLLNRNAGSRQSQEQRSPAMAIKEYWHDRQLKEQQETPTIFVDENTKQADIIRQTLEHRQSQAFSRRISKTIQGIPTKPKPTQNIDVKATEQLFLQAQQKKELLKTTQSQRPTNLSNAPSRTTEIGLSSWVQSRDHGLDAPETTSNKSGSTELPEYSGSKQHGFIQSAVRSSSTPSNKKEKTTTWTRIRDSIAGSKANEAEDVDFSLWVQELDQAKGSQRLPEEFKSLSVPASMLGSLPASSNTGRYAVQPIDDVLNAGGDGGEAGLTKKVGKRGEAQENQTYRVVDLVQSKPTRENQMAAMGQGKPIDQSNLLGFYVNKQKEAINATTIGYLSSMIYGDPEEEEAKIQKKLLERQLAQKKKQEQREREQLKHAVQHTIMSKPKTIFSSFV